MPPVGDFPEIFFLSVTDKEERAQLRYVVKRHLSQNVIKHQVKLHLLRFLLLFIKSSRVNVLLAFAPVMRLGIDLVR